MLEELQSSILDELHALSECVEAYTAALTHFANADHEYRKAQSRALLDIVIDCEKRNVKEPTVDVKKAKVDHVCEIERLRERLAEADKDGLKARMDAHRCKISALQSVLRLRADEVNRIHFGQEA